MRSDFITLKYIFFSKLYNFVLFFTMDSEQPASSGLKVMTRNELFNIMERSGASTFNEKILIMEQEVLNQYEGNDQNIAEIKQKLSIIRHQFKQRWSAAHNTKARFLERNKDWLQGSISLPKTGVSPGRPQKSFSDLSERSKRRKTEELRGAGTDELTYATQMKLRETGKVDASKIVKDLTKSPTRARKYAVAIKKKTSETNEESREDKHLRALFMYTEAGLTQTQYEIVRDSNPSFYPCYSILQKLKKECYPDIHRITETCAEVTVQSLMDHTAQRLLMHLGEADLNQQLNSAEKQSLVLISKWGYDGSQQMQFKMKFVNEADSDANIFQSSMVPLQLVYGPERKILWQNPKPSSPRYCRPIRIRFVKETTDITNEEIAIIKTQISELTKTRVNDFSIGHKLLFTMVDGKVCNAATHTKSTMRCYLCGATSAV
ncbi:uncharacterized protein LOC121725968 [Aricia agestis]|uniref:uncharacterized protein LOC121725968 n=1 Tax=Aricia agestis TaxID=91739 RepID=UPI001C209693|nr:uncharacterized protein LOC121725968 [Aricia agestis]